MEIQIVTPEQLAEALAENRRATIEEIQKLLSEKLPDSQPKYISRKQAAELLGASVVAIDNWTKKGILQRYRIGGRWRYDSNEVISSVKNPGK